MQHISETVCNQWKWGMFIPGELCLLCQSDSGGEVNNELANHMSLFYANATPMLKTLSNATSKFVSDVSPFNHLITKTCKTVSPEHQENNTFIQISNTLIKIGYLQSDSLCRNNYGWNFADILQIVLN